MKRWIVALLLVMVCTSTTHAQKWYEGGTLHSDKISAWLVATDANQLATAGDFVAGTTASDQLRALSSSALKKSAQTVADCITEKSDAGVFAKDMTVEAAAMRCLKDNQKQYVFFLSKIGVGETEQTPAAPVDEQVWDVAKAKPLPYAVIKADKDHRAATGRTKLILRIVLAEEAKGEIVPKTDQKGITREQLAATVIAAAKHHAEITNAHMVGVVLDGGFSAPAAHIQLARGNYAPDGKGVSGTQNWTWNDLRAAERGLTPEEQKEGGYLSLDEVPLSIADAVQPAPSLRPRK